MNISLALESEITRKNALAPKVRCDLWLMGMAYILTAKDDQVLRQ